MILLISYDVRRRGGIERLSLQVQACLQQRGQAVRLLCPQRLGPGGLGRQLGRLWRQLGQPRSQRRWRERTCRWQQH